MSRPLVVLSGIYYPMAILRYFEAAFKRREDIDLLTVGVYTGRRIPWGGGMVLSERYAKPPDVVLPEVCKKGVPIQMALSKLDRKPDLWVQVDAGMWLMGKSPGVMNVVVGTDPHVLNYTHQRKVADKFFCMQLHYAQDGDVYLPYAYDPIWHCPEVQPKRYDAALIGLAYGERTLWVSRLRQRGIKVKFELGPVFEEARSIYGQSRIGLNWSSREDLVARVFEVTAMGLPLVTNVVPDLHRFFAPGEDLLVFSDLDGAVQQVRRVLQDNMLAERIAQNGRSKVGPHTYDARVAQILKETGFA